MKLWKTNDPHFIITKKCQKQFRGPFFYFLSTYRERTLGGRAEATSHSWAKRQNPVRNEIQNIREIDTDHTCASNDLASFDAETEAI